MPIRTRPPLSRPRPSPLSASRAWGQRLGLVALIAFSANAAASPSRPSGTADFGQHAASPEVMQVVHWISESGDNGGLPFIVIDKVAARVFVFDAQGALQGADPALLGMARGDHTPEGIRDLKLSAIRPEDRTTPAGRFVAHLDRDSHGRGILLIDYDASIALHPVVKGQPAERRAERLESENPEDNRISFGCINVPARFYETVVQRVFTQTSGIVYILPEMSDASEMFGP